jgi:glutathione S-transferase
MLQLYHYWDSTCSMKARYAVMEKALDCELVFVDLLSFEQLQPDYLRLNPNGVAPTLVHDGEAIVESTVINEYLEEAFPERPLLPADLLDRARVRSLVRIEDGKMHEAFRAPTFNLLIKPRFANASDAEIETIVAHHPQKWIGAYWKKAIKEPTDQAAIDQSFDDLRDVMGKLDAALADGRPWLGGEDVSLAECAFVSLVDRTENLGRGDLFNDYEYLGRWRGRLKARPAYGQAIPPKGKRLLSIPIGGQESAQKGDAT